MMTGSGTAHLRPGADPILSVEHLVQEFKSSRGAVVHAVSDVSFDLLQGETLGLVGESGCGKSTTARALMMLGQPTSGRVVFEGTDLATLKSSELRRIRPRLQMIFQDPVSSLNPRMRVAQLVSAPLRIWGIGDEKERTDRVRAALETVGLDPETTLDRRPHELSGGQSQRVSIARAMVLGPKVIVCDEPVSALDVSVQAQILNLLEDMKADHGLSLVFISHDLAVIKNISDRIAVMYLGRLCEIAPPDVLYDSPAHPYTAALLSAVPIADPAAARPTTAAISGELPSPTSPPSGCRFRTRCPIATDLCADVEPTMSEVTTDHHVACHFPLNG